MSTFTKTSSRDRRKKRIRAKISGTEERPRLSVFKSNTGIQAQIINDDLGVTIASATGKDASAVGKEVAKKAIAKNVLSVVFDRGGYIYIGKVKALAEGAREGGLKF